MPTTEQLNTTTTRAAHLGYRALIVAGSHVELLDATSGRCVGRVGTCQGGFCPDFLALEILPS